MLGNEEAGHVHIHPKLPLTLVGFKSGRVSLFNASQEQVFSHHVLELKSVLFADEHTLRESGLGRPSTTTPIATATVTTMIAVCAKQICTFDSIHTSLVRITPELDGASLTGAVLQLDADHFILGTSLGSLVLYSLGQRSIIKFAQATMNIHKRPISSMVAVSPTSLVVGCVGSAFLSVWDLVRGNNNKSNNNSSSSFALSHSRRIVLYTGKANVPAAMEVLELRFDPTAKLLACKLGAQSTVIWDMAAAATERLVHRVSGLVELPLNLNHCHHLSVLVIRDGKLVSALPQSSARNLAAGLENSVVLSETKFTGGGKLSLLPNNPDQEELAIPIRVVVPHLGQHKITRFWQHPHQPDCYLVQCSDHTLRFTQVSRPPVAPSSFAGERLYLKDNTLVYRSQRDATMAHLYPALHSDPEEFLRHKDHLLKIAETGALTEEDCAAAEALWPGRIDLQLCSSDGKHKDFLLASWREAGQFALITNLSPLGGEGVVTTLLAGACTAVGFAAREGGEVGVLVARRKLERSAPSSLPSSSVDAPPSTSMFRRGSMTFNSNANMSSFRKRLSLPVNSASAAAATAAAEKKPSTFVLAVYQVSADHAQVSHEVELERAVDGIVACGGGIVALRSSVGSGGKPWTKFFQLNKEDGKLTLVPGSPTLPRHILAATWQRADDGVTMAFTCEGLAGRIAVLDVDLVHGLVRYRCQVLVNPAQAAVVSLHWHVGTLLFTTDTGEVHLAFVGLALRTNEPSWVLAANKKRCCVARVERERVVLVDADTGVELEPTVSLASPLIKTGMLASAGFGQSAQRWAQSLGTELDKNVAVGLLQRLGFPLRAAGVVGASPHVLLDLMLEHESCRTQALQVFHRSQPAFAQLIHQSLESAPENGLADAERLALLFASMKRLDAVGWVAAALPANCIQQRFCKGLVNQQQQQLLTGVNQ